MLYASGGPGRRRSVSPGGGNSYVDGYMSSDDLQRRHSHQVEFSGFSSDEEEDGLSNRSTPLRPAWSAVFNEDLRRHRSMELRPTNSEELPKIGKTKRPPEEALSIHSMLSDSESDSSMLLDPAETSPEELRRQMRFLINPQGKFRQTLDMVLAFILMYNIVTTPFRVCFEEDAEGAWLVIESIFDILFWIDLVCNFRTAIEVSKVGVGAVYGMEKAEFITNSKEIALRYLKGWFWVDFLSVFPFSEISLSLFAGSNSRTIERLPKSVRLLKLVRLLRLLRLFRLNRLYRKWHVFFSLNSTRLHVVRLMVLMCLFAHFFGCFFHLIAVVQDDGVSTWIAIFAQTESNSVFSRYVVSVYWAVMTLTNIGYGDVVAKTLPERVYVVIAMLLAVVIFSYTLGSVSFLVLRTRSDPLHGHIDAVNEYLDFRNVPEALRNRIRQHYIVVWRTQQAAHNEKIFLAELPKSLRGELAFHLKEKVLHNNVLFKGASSSFIVDIIMRLDPRVAFPGEMVVVEGAPGAEMFMLSQGKVAVQMSDGTVLKVLQEGDYFGEIAILKVDCLRSASVKALTFCQLDVLSRADFVEVLSCYANEVDLDAFLNLALKRLAKLQMSRKKQGLVDDLVEEKEEVLPPRPSLPAPVVSVTPADPAPVPLGGTANLATRVQKAFGHDFLRPHTAKRRAGNIVGERMRIILSTSKDVEKRMFAEVDVNVPLGVLKEQCGIYLGLKEAGQVATEVAVMAGASNQTRVPLTSPANLRENDIVVVDVQDVSEQSDVNETVTARPTKLSDLEAAIKRLSDGTTDTAPTASLEGEAANPPTPASPAVTTQTSHEALLPGTVE